MTTNQALIDEIGRAFPAPTIDATRAFEHSGRMYPDAAAYLEKIQARTWRDMDAQWLVKRSDALGFLGTRWLVAVMPVYLIAAVEGGVWSPATEMLVLILTRPDVGSDTGLGRKRFVALVDALTADQRSVVGDVIEHISQIDPEGSLGLAAREAFVCCWKDYGRSSSAT